MRSVIEGLDLHDVVIVGHSMGGIAVQSFCLRHPDIAAAARRGHRAAVDARPSPLRRATLRGVASRVYDEACAPLPDVGGVRAQPRSAARADRVRAPIREPSHVELDRAR